jgi:hypothetical protein
MSPLPYLSVKNRIAGTLWVPERIKVRGFSFYSSSPFVKGEISCLLSPARERIKVREFLCSLFREKRLRVIFP